MNTQSILKMKEKFLKKIYLFEIKNKKQIVLIVAPTLEHEKSTSHLFQQQPKKSTKYFFQVIL
jgi:hypothetical protein